MRFPLTPLQRLALEELRRQGDIEPDMLRIELRLGSIYSAIGRQLSEEDLGGTAMPAVQNGTPRHEGKEFSPTEAAIMSKITSEWQTKVELAAACSMSMSSQFCAILTNLVEREYLESSHRGYRRRPG